MTQSHQEKTLYLTEQGSSLHQEKDRLVLYKNNQVLARIPFFQIERVLVFGSIQITTQTFQRLLKHGVDIAFLSSRGRLHGRAQASTSGNVVLRLAQYDRCRDLPYCLDFTRHVLHAKINSQRLFLQRFARNHPDPLLSQAVQHIESLQSRVLQSQSIQEAMGFEGASSAAYFHTFPILLRADIPFSGRNRRPPRDPANSLLSFGYTLLLNEVLSSLEAHGLDTMLGMTHGFVHGRDSLGLDLIEEHRTSLVDRFVVALFNRRQFTQDDFSDSLEQGTRLLPQSLQRFLSLWEERMRGTQTPHQPSPRQVIVAQVHSLEEAIIHKNIYTPHTWDE